MKRLASAGGRRLDIRLNKAFAIVIATELDGEQLAVARNISAGGMFVEMRDPPPLGAVVTISFSPPDESEPIRVTAEVKHHFCFNFQVRDEPTATRGIGVRFIEFLGPDDAEGSYRRHRVLH